MKNDDVYVDALKKKAEGFTATEISEEYSSDGDGNLVLVKRKVNQNIIRPTPRQSKAFSIWTFSKPCPTKNSKTKNAGSLPSLQI